MSDIGDGQLAMYTTALVMQDDLLVEGGLDDVVGARGAAAALPLSAASSRIAVFCRRGSWSSPRSRCRRSPDRWWSCRAPRRSSFSSPSSGSSSVVQLTLPFVVVRLGLGSPAALLRLEPERLTGFVIAVDQPTDDPAAVRPRVVDVFTVAPR